MVQAPAAQKRTRPCTGLFGCCGLLEIPFMLNLSEQVPSPVGAVPIDTSPITRSVLSLSRNKPHSPFVLESPISRSC